MKSNNERKKTTKKKKTSKDMVKSHKNKTKIIVGYRI